MLLYKPIFHHCSEFTTALRRLECSRMERELLLHEDLQEFLRGVSQNYYN